MEGNVVAGSEQAGFQTYGELCQDATKWNNNEVHSAMYGVLLWKKGASGDPSACRRVNDVYAWRVWDTAFYMQHYASLQLKNVKVVDCTVGVNQLVYGPRSLDHASYDKTSSVEDSVFVGGSPSHTCGYDDSDAKMELAFPNSLWPGSVGGGNLGITFGSFMSGVNMAPKHPFHNPDGYPAIRGGSFYTNVKFIDYNTRSCGKDVAMGTNPDGDDATHPVFVKGVTMVNSAQDNYLYMDKPSLGAVNPSDCVDMTCDGHKKVIVEDKDGSFLGAVGATATAMAEYEWDGDRSHGVGDYRIPIPLRENIDGSKITAAEKFPNKGIFRDNSCTKVDAWRAWKCTAVKHRMMIIESMDGDTEIRRLSPIALIANPGTNGYVDLLNGPMDRGWCFGYTCQERISTFYSVVAAGKTYEMAMASTPPQVMRFQLLHSSTSEVVVLRLYYPKTQRYDVYVDDVFVPPTNIDNSKYPAKYELVTGSDKDPKYIPKASDPSGTNYLERNKKFLHVVLRGGQVIDIKTTPTVILNMGLVVDPDNFFEENVVQNMALMLGVAPGNIRITNVIREDSGRRRKKRNTVVYQFEFEISSPPTASANATTIVVAVNGSSAEVLTYQDLLDTIVKAVDTFQSNACEDCNITIANLEVIEPLPPPKDPPPTATEEAGSVVVTNGTLFSDVQQALEEANLEVLLKAVTFESPSSSHLEQDVPSEVTAFTVFPTQPIYNVLSANGSVIQSLGHASDPWMVTAFLSGGPSDAVLLGTTKVPYLNGAANFTDLSINKPGAGYQLAFNITYPVAAPTLPSFSEVFEAKPKNVLLEIAYAPDDVMSDELFNITLDLTDIDTGEPMDPSQLEGQQMIGMVQLVKGGSAQLMGNTNFTLDGGNMSSFVLDDLYFTEYESSYQISVSADVLPAGWNLNVTDVITGTPDTTESPAEVSDPVLVTMSGDRKSSNILKNEAKFAGLLLGVLNETVGNAVNWQVTVKSVNMYPHAEILVSGDTQLVTYALMDICELVTDGKLQVTFDSNVYTMGYIDLYIKGTHRNCPAALVPQISIHIIQKVG